MVGDGLGGGGGWKGLLTAAQNVRVGKSGDANVLRLISRHDKIFTNNPQS